MISIKSNVLAGWGSVVATSSGVTPPPPDGPSLFIYPPLIVPTLTL